MTEPEDILTDFEERKEPWGWHNELTFTAMLVMFLPVLLIVAIVQLFNKNNIDR